MMAARRSALLFALVGTAVLSGVGDSTAKEAPGPVTAVTMYWNVYLGAALEPVIEAAVANPESLPLAAGEAWAQVQATDFTTRAGLIADRVREENPDVLGLGEVALWRLQEPADSISEHPRPARKVVYDFLKILRKELRARKLPYRVAVCRKGVDIEMPAVVGEGLADVRFTDRDAVLVRRGVRASKRRSGNFAAYMPLGFADVVRSWTSVDLKKGKSRFRFIATHLEDGVEEVQVLQAAEILEGPAATDLPVVLAGDFNADALNGYSAAVPGVILEGGFTDAWEQVNPSDPGLTWGHDADLMNGTNLFTLRLDHVFVRGGATPTAARLVGEDPADRSEGGLWPSDHAGLVVEVTLP